MKTEEKDYVALAIEHEERSVKFLGDRLKDLKASIKDAAIRQREAKEAVAVLSRATATREGGSLSTAALAFAIKSGKNLVNNSEKVRADLREKLKNSRAILEALKASQTK